MRHFITKKVIRVPRYKLWYVACFCSIVLIIIANILVSLYLNKIDRNNFLKVVMGNATGNIMNNYNVYCNKKDMFYKNIYGFQIIEEKSAFNNINNIKDIVIDKENLREEIVYIYNTFQTDKYKNNYYSSYTINSVVTEASLILKEYLKNNGINSVVETNSVVKTLKEENLKYTDSYKGSRILLEKAKKNKDTLKYFFDIQLSSSDYNETTINIDEINYAKILFVIGTDNENYKANLKFANSLNENLSNINGKLSRGVSLQGGSGYHGIYNEDFSDKTLMIRIGGKENTIDEVSRSISVLAKVIADYIKEEEYEKE